jgi:hypothetical protein
MSNYIRWRRAYYRSIRETLAGIPEFPRACSPAAEKMGGKRAERI